MAKRKKKKSLLGKLIWKTIKLIPVLIVALITVAGAVRLASWFDLCITGKNSVDEGIYVDLCDQEQFLRIRGEDQSNPVVIWLHGGPAGPDSYVNHVWQKYMVGNYTFINWDQRGCGRTYFHNIELDPENKTVTFEQALLDLDELVNYACSRFGCKKVILVGHSYGSLLGSKYAMDHPEKVSAYVGVGQMVSLESEELSYQQALSLAKNQDENTDEMVAAYTAWQQNESIINMMNLRKHTYPYLQAEKKTNLLWLGLSSPYMWASDFRWFFVQMKDMEEYFAINQPLFDHIMDSDVRTYGKRHTVPTGFISGSDDWTTPAQMTKEYHDRLLAPRKRFALMDGSGHTPQLDDPKSFAEVLENMLEELLP